MKNKLWLPTGLHNDLHIERSKGGDAGSFTGGGWKLCWHITVSPWFDINPMVNLLHNKRAEPHFVIGGKPGVRLPVVSQLVALNRAGRSLQHAPGTPETNKANCIQVEICATVGNAHRLVGEHDLFTLPDVELPSDVMQAALNGSSKEAMEMLKICLSEDDELARAYHSGVASWTDDTYKALANLTQWIDHRVRIPRQCARTFQNTKRFSGPGWVDAAGHLGHCHAPWPNTHFDPTKDFKGKHLVNLTEKNHPYAL